MGSSKKKPDAPKMPTANELRPLIELQAQYNRVGTETPFGSQNYRRNPDGTFSMVTDIGPEGRGLVGRAVGIGMTDGNRMQVPEQISGIASALADRIGSRFGLPAGGGFQLAPQAAMPPAKQQLQAPPAAGGLPGVPPGVTPPSTGPSIGGNRAPTGSGGGMFVGSDLGSQIDRLRQGRGYRGMTP